MIRVSGLCFSVGGFSLRSVSLDVASGEYFVLLGPTGAGKTLFTECLCGLLRPSGGTIEIDGRDVTRLAPRLRGIGYAPQHQGLFPHLSVRENIAFALRARRVGREETRERVAAMADLLGLGHLLERWPAHLSGGERQKVAIARALAPRPRLLILDEPVSAVDESSRELVCAELRRLQRELQITTLHVSHNLEEAFSVGDRAGLFHDGRLVQTGPVAELLRRPATELAARFFRAENIFQATATPAPDGSAELRFAGHTLRVPSSSFSSLSSSLSSLLRDAGRGTRGGVGAGPRARPGPEEGQAQGPAPTSSSSRTVTFLIRPEAVQVHPPGASVPNAVPGVLRAVSDRGHYRRLEFDAGVPIVVYITADAAALAPAIGQNHTLAFPPDAIHVLPEEKNG